MARVYAVRSRTVQIREKSPVSVKGDSVDDFALFYARYPRHVGKLAAQRAYVRARRLAGVQDIMDGLERYIASKPAWQDWAYPSSWLNAGRWMDELPRQAQTVDYAWTCLHVPKCNARHACLVKTTLEAARHSA